MVKGKSENLAEIDKIITDLERRLLEVDYSNYCIVHLSRVKYEIKRQLKLCEPLTKNLSPE